MRIEALGSELNEESLQRDLPGRLAAATTRLRTLSIKKLVRKLIPRSCGCIANADFHFGSRG